MRCRFYHKTSLFFLLIIIIFKPFSISQTSRDLKPQLLSFDDMFYSFFEKAANCPGDGSVKDEVEEAWIEAEAPIFIECLKIDFRDFVSKK